MSLEVTGADPEKSYSFLKQFDDECYIWMTELWLNKISGSSQLIEIINAQSNLKNLKDYLNNKIRQFDQEQLDFCRERFIRNKSKYLPSEHLKVFQQNRRLNWFAIHVILKDDKEYRINDLPFTDPYTFLLYLIYIKAHPWKLDEHIDTLTKIRKKFIEILEEKNNLNTYIEDNNFIEWACLYIQSNRDIKFNTYNVIGFPLDTPQSKRDYVLSVFDQILYNNDREKFNYYHLVNKLKKAWQQKTFRDKGGLKQPYHIPLTKVARNELKKLAEHKNTTEGILLSKLINEAFLKEMCDEKGKSLY
ncbi:hypothetical protein [Acinetobacter sp. ANC 4178]|uniref:hypothetical protein n=1 Tax=Acinetobacter sp. ANC 4178 TaxID=2529839 RepID=UPI0010404914|nr:hypothetical protein [Acinetobacter sp. ANC 4178]TCB65517.1 hypothetical protein E0H87_13865 [Acinetobacter sp. ANC 4178]